MMLLHCIFYVSLHVCVVGKRVKTAQACAHFAEFMLPSVCNSFALLRPPTQFSLRITCGNQYRFCFLLFFCFFVLFCLLPIDIRQVAMATYQPNTAQLNTEEDVPPPQDSASQCGSSTSSVNSRAQLADTRARLQAKQATLNQKHALEERVAAEGDAAANGATTAAGERSLQPACGDKRGKCRIGGYSASRGGNQPSTTLALPAATPVSACTKYDRVWGWLSPLSFIIARFKLSVWLHKAL